VDAPPREECLRRRVFEVAEESAVGRGTLRLRAWICLRQGRPYGPDKDAGPARTAHWRQSTKGSVPGKAGQPEPPAAKALRPVLRPGGRRWRMGIGRRMWYNSLKHFIFTGREGLW